MPFNPTLEAVCLLPLYYFPPVSWWTLVYHSKKILLYKPKRLSKQSYYYRFYIKGNQKIETLVIPLKRKTIFRAEPQIAYQEPWQKQHWHAIQTCYQKSAFFEHYFEDLKQLRGPQPFLYAWNLQCILFLLRALHLEEKLLLSQTIANYIHLPLLYPRLPIKHRKKIPWLELNYYQFFGEFAYDLSIIDVLMHYALETRLILKNSFKPAFFRPSEHFYRMQWKEVLSSGLLRFPA